MSSEPVDRRGFVRVPFNTDAEIRAAEQIFRSSNGIDVSMSGLRLFTKDALPEEGAPCQVKITLRASDSQVVIEAKAEVIRSEPGSIAVRFTEIDLDSYHHLKQLILNNTDEPEKAEREFSAHWGIRRHS